ncbi:MAG: tetratricopeptide repeat protein [Candidatus Sericytochromatia bacterium]
MGIQSNSPLRPTAPTPQTTPTHGVTQTEPGQTTTPPTPTTPVTRPPQGGSGPAGLTTPQIEGDVNQALRGGAGSLQEPEADQRYQQLEVALPQLSGGQPSTQTNTAQAQQHFSEGTERFRHGDYAGAERLFRQALSETPSGEAQAQMQYNLGMALERQGNTRGAAEQYQSFLEHAPTGDAESITHARTQVGQQSVREGMSSFEAGNFREAEQHFSDALGQLPPGNNQLQSEVTYNLARSLEAQGNPQGAREQYQNFLDRAPANTDRSAIQHAQQQVQAAGGGVPPASGPGNSQLARQHFQAGSDAFSQGNFSEAATAFRSSLEQTPASNPTARSQLSYDIGRALARSGDTQGATEAYRNFLASAPPGTERAAIQEAQRFLQEQSTAVPF